MNLKNKELQNITINDFKRLWYKCGVENSFYSIADLLEYLTGNDRTDIISQFSVDEIICAIYSVYTNDIYKFTGEKFWQKNIARCSDDIFFALQKIADYKGILQKYDSSADYFYMTSIFEICRRNDARVLNFYLENFMDVQSEYSIIKDMYDNVLDYYVYMYLENWDLLEKFNSDMCQKDIEPSVEHQELMLQTLKQQAVKNNAPMPDALEVLLKYKSPSSRVYFNLGSLFAAMNIGMEFSSRNSYSTPYSAHLVLQNEIANISPGKCIDAEELYSLLKDSGNAYCVTCSCGFAECGGIYAPAESHRFGEQMNLFISIGKQVYYFRIERRKKLQELLFMLKLMLDSLKNCSQHYETVFAQKCFNLNEACAPYGVKIKNIRELIEKIEADL